jgi:23S rRNA (cytidine1920-2'-O)/16S rRNA (cytidine1409-2'-O)-methyltransferase
VSAGAQLPLSPRPLGLIGARNVDPKSDTICRGFGLYTGFISVISITEVREGVSATSSALALTYTAWTLCKGSSAMAKLRLDTLLAERGLFPSRSRAAASVMAGEVFLVPASSSARAGERRAGKPGELVDVETQVRVAQGQAFVSRGGIKLANALEACGLDVRGRRALDVGASTGGFTDCLLQRGAREVIAVDVGYGILDYRLRIDPRVSVVERTNARTLTPEMLPVPVPVSAGDIPLDLASVDVSFISLGKVLGAILGCMGAHYDVLALVKPQFELGRERIGKGGVVRDADARREALIGVGRRALELGAAVVGYHSSGLPGPKGNRETFLWLADRDRGVASRDVTILEQLAREVEP